jgi:hypothetical protein
VYRRVSRKVAVLSALVMGMDDGGESRRSKPRCEDPAGNEILRSRSIRSARRPDGARALCSLLLGSLGLLVSHSALARGNGVGTGGCSGCHTGGKPATATITANPALFGPGQKTTLTVSVSRTNGPSAGFYLYSSAVGTFTVVDPGTKLIGIGVTHTTTRVSSGAVTTFQVAWTAPATPGGVLFSVWANSANGDGRSGGDGEGVGVLSTAFGCAGTKYYRDADGDGVGAEISGYIVDCSLPQNYSTVGSDCDDNDQHVYAGAVEVCDGRDNDCDGQVDEDLPVIDYCSDADGDGHGVSGKKTARGCMPPGGLGLCDNDCNDENPALYPTAVELCNNRDDNCNGVIDEKARASCGVGWCARYADDCLGVCTPGQPRSEECNAFDDDCDGVVDNGSDLKLCGRAGFACRVGQCVADSNAGGMNSGGSTTVGPGGSAGSTGGSGGGTGFTVGGAGGSHVAATAVPPNNNDASGSCALSSGFGRSVNHSSVLLLVALLLVAQDRRKRGLRRSVSHPC